MIIISIVAGLGIPTYFKAVENAKLKERDSMMELLQDAARMYHLEKAAWPLCIDTDQCNNDLNLNFSDTWIYSIETVSGTPKVCAENPKDSTDKTCIPF